MLKTEFGSSRYSRENEGKENRLRCYAYVERRINDEMVKKIRAIGENAKEEDGQKINGSTLLREI